jgi:septal ring factor EnvC (AmiA/AmiB activator)
VLLQQLESKLQANLDSLKNGHADHERRLVAVEAHNTQQDQRMDRIEEAIAELRQEGGSSCLCSGVQPMMARMASAWEYW